MWTGILAYLANMFSCLKNLNSSLQDDCTKIFTLHNKTDNKQNNKTKMMFLKRRWCFEIIMCREAIPCMQDLVGSASVTKKSYLYDKPVLRRAYD